MSNINETTCVRMSALPNITGLSRSTIYRLIRSKDFPEGFQISEKCVVYRLCDIYAWQCAKRGVAPNQNNNLPNPA